jgi:hypothetical protein
MVRDGTVHVEHIRITRGPNKNLEGWAVVGYLQCECGPYP